tara:strand:- start:2072 stop:2230 length:159 start_codon:yes stop_codon:yes gene_type:complete
MDILEFLGGSQLAKKGKKKSKDSKKKTDFEIWSKVLKERGIEVPKEATDEND